MARIPTGNFGNTQVPVARSAQPNLSGVQAIGNAVSHLGDTVSGVALGLQRQEQQEREEMARIKAANALLDHELAIKQIGLGVQDDVASGKLDYLQAEDEFNKRASKHRLPTIDGADSALLENMSLGARRQTASAAMGMQAFTQEKRRDDYRSQFASGLDTLSKLAAMPGADVAAINARAEAAVPLAKQAGIDQSQIEGALSTFREQNWTNRVSTEILDAGNDIGSLKSVKQQLVDEDGTYLDKLDPAKRLALAKSIDNQIEQIEYRAQLQTDRLDAQAQRTLLSVSQQTATGVPATAAMWDKWGKQVQGSQYEEDFKALAANEATVQEVLRKPITEQVQYVQAQQAALQSGGGDVRTIANVQSLTTAVQANVKRLAEEPLTFYQQRTGEPVAPIDAAVVLQPGGGEVLAAQMQDRASIIDGLRKQNGDLVQLRPLLPQEAKQFSAIIDNATPAEQAKLFGTLRDAIGDHRIYAGAMQQIAPDSPVRAAAGMLMSHNGQQTTESNWLSPNQTVTAERAATTMLAGEAILNKSKAQSAGDGKPVALPVPSEKIFADEVSARVGDAFAGRPKALQAALQAVRAHYTGASSEAGDFSPDMDVGRLDESIRASLGEVVKYRDNNLLLPWGMDETTFRDRFGLSLSATLQARGLSPDQVNAQIVNVPRLDLMNFGDGEYLVLDSARRPYLVKGEPVTVRVTAP